jgi:hypothetical protein
MDTAGDASWSLRLHCPISPRVSPHADAAQDWLNGWVRQFGLPLDERGLEQFAGASFARYAGRLYPDASPLDLRTVTALFTWFFLLDDACDGSPGGPPLDVGGLRDGVVRLLCDGPQAWHPAFTGPLRRMLADIWPAVQGRMSASWRERFISAVAHHLDGVMVEVRNKAAGHRPSIAEYVELRRATSAAYVSYTLIEFVTGKPVPDAVYHHPWVREIAATGNDLLSWFNDLVSLERDVATSGEHNLVLAVACTEGLSIGDAIHEVAGRWQDQMNRFAQLRAAVPSFGPPMDEALRHYLDGVGHSVRGTIDWSLECTRYRDSMVATSVEFTGDGRDRAV